VVAFNILVANVAYAARLVMPLLLLPFLSRRLESSDYGHYMYAMAVAQWLGLFIEFGFNLSATREVSAASSPKIIARIVAGTQDARLTLAALAAIPTLALLLWSPQFKLAPQWALVSWFYGALVALVPQYYFQGTHRLRDVALADLVCAAATLATVTALVDRSNVGIVLPVMVLAPRLVSTAFLTRRMQKMLALNREVRGYSFARARRSLAAGIVMFKFQIYVSLYTSFNLILAGWFFSAAQIGAYASADRIIRAGLGFFSQISAAIFPKFVSMRASGNGYLLRARSLVLGGMLGLGLLGSAIVWMAAPTLARLLFGDAHELAGEILRIEAGVVPAIAISSVLSIHYLLVDGQERSLNRVVLTAAAINVPLCVCLMTRLGVRGGAISWVTIEWAISTTLVALVVLRPHANRIKESK
jgi:PST family polysaccharide transporter